MSWCKWPILPSFAPKKFIMPLLLAMDQHNFICSLLTNEPGCHLKSGGIHMRFDAPDLERIGRAFLRKESPTEELLQQWGNQNHTILELFIIMYEMKQFQAMKILQPFGERLRKHFEL